MNNEGLTKLREYIRKDKPKVLRKDFAFQEPLSWGWMLPYLLGLEDMTWQRWEYWAQTKLAGRLLPEPIPQIEWAAQHGDGSPGRRMLEKSLDCVTKHGDWRGWSSATYFEFFLDWLLFGLGHPSQREHPKVHQDCEGASERLYQTFNLEPLLAYPHDYFGDMMAENAYGRRAGFFPTPMEVAAMMVAMQMGDGEDMRAKTVCDPALGTGRMILCASNYSLRLYGQDIMPLVIKACLVNAYLYAPWIVRPFDFLDSYDADTGQPTAHLAVKRTSALVESIEVPSTTAQPSTPQLELCLS